MTKDYKTLDIDPNKLSEPGDGINGSQKHDGPQGYTSYEYTKSGGESFELRFISYENEKYLPFLPPKGKISKVTIYYANRGTILLAVQIATEKDRNYYYICKDVSKTVDEDSEFYEFVENGKKRLTNQDIRTILQKVETNKFYYEQLSNDLRGKLWRKNDSTVDISRYPGGSGNKKVRQDAKGGYYYTNEVGVRVNLTVENYPDRDGSYTKLTHTPENGELGTIKHGRGFYFLRPEPTDESSVSVYYWKYDTTHEKVLLIQLGDGDPSVYYTTSSSTNGIVWKNDEHSKIKEDSLKELNKQNCLRNEAHAINISEKSESYQCPSCTKYKIDILLDREKQYYIHSFTVTKNKESPSISRFFEGDLEQTGFPFVAGMNNICVYWSEDSSKPSLIYFFIGGYHWYSRYLGETFWEKETSLKNSQASEKSNIPNILKKYATPKVILDASHTEEGKTTYSPRRNTLTFRVSKDTVEQSYSQYTHSKYQDNKGFKLKNIEHKGNLLGINSDDLLTDVTVFYWNKDENHYKPLLIELKLQTPTTYKYYQKLGKNVVWTEYPRSEATTQLLNEDLKKELDRLKEIHFPDSGLGTGAKAGIGIASVLGGGTAIGVTVWKWPSILSFIITRV
ncbi:hypothetical protein BEWA_047800 [Theileria equi strain WA]|uniref:Uncharacterized protein n=1 Tax=Theileria equi strain WA TaxID=1537102 RepID=L1LAL4_THEEQ|nr:hypothetical protein BEWA_047800 [Theileria equi strain WA]EKX72315.1 hypothetical protein BEWA_047800 [Theileria equi strain WA]|eukprot:XP_004831767.1 hypothetical protein BEWA_047800 [Theileria equi strain WA]